MSTSTWTGSYSLFEGILVLEKVPGFSVINGLLHDVVHDLFDTVPYLVLEIVNWENCTQNPPLRQYLFTTWPPRALVDYAPQSKAKFH